MLFSFCLLSCGRNDARIRSAAGRLLSPNLKTKTPSKIISQTRHHSRNPPTNLFDFSHHQFYILASAVHFSPITILFNVSTLFFASILYFPIFFDSFRVIFRQVPSPTPVFGGWTILLFYLTSSGPPFLQLSILTHPLFQSQWYPNSSF